MSFVYVFSFCSFLLGPQMLQFSSSWAAGYIVQSRMSFFFNNIFQMSSSHSVRKIVLLVFPLFFLILLQIINKKKKKKKKKASHVLFSRNAIQLFCISNVIKILTVIISYENNVAHIYNKLITQHGAKFGVFVALIFFNHPLISISSSFFRFSFYIYIYIYRDYEEKVPF